MLEISMILALLFLLPMKS